MTRPSGPYGEYRKSERVCEVCGRKAQGNAKRKHCSRACQAKAYRARKAKPPKPKLLILRECQGCGGLFPQRKAKGKETNRYCSRSCSDVNVKDWQNHEALRKPDTVKRLALRRARKARRDRIKGNGPVEDIPLQALHSRDGGICYLCGSSVDLTLPLHHRQGATRDHVVPIAEGGTHTWANVRLAHRRCNSLKGLGRPTAEMADR